MSVTTAGLAPAPTEHLLDDVRLAVLPASAGWRLAGDVLEIHSEEELEIRLSVPLGDAVGFWHPGAGWERTIVADWAGLARVSVVRGAVAGCLYDSRGTSMLAFAALDPLPETTMRYGVSEENKTFVVHLRVPARRSPYRLALSPIAPSVATAMRTLRRALGEGRTPSAPEGARTPVYSTWYGFNQAVEASAVEAEARLAASMGCGALILDDGWQRFGNGRGYAGVGDWSPDPAKFPDLAGHVARVRAMGLKYLIWVAPLLLGPQAEAFPTLAHLAPLEARAPGARVLDPRIPEVRRHVVELCVRLVRDYGLDGLKLDFLDQAEVYGDGAAVHTLMTEVAAALEAVRPGVLIEFRQPYVGPGMTPFATMLRANDCPSDAVANRVRTIDIGLLAVGGAVHADMVMWDPAGSTTSAARQLIGALHAVPQISARLAGLPGPHLRMVAFWLEQWRALRPLLLDGEVEPGRPDELYPVVRAASNSACVITVTADRVVTLDATRFKTITVVNGTASERLIVDVRGEGLSVRRVFDAEGSKIEAPARNLPTGLGIVHVPPSGLAVLEESQ